jgi:Cytochrome P460
MIDADLQCWCNARQLTAATSQRSTKEKSMLYDSARVRRYGGALRSCIAIALCGVCVAKSAASSSKEDQPRAGPVANPTNASPIYGVTIPDGYRDWKLIAVNQIQLTGKGEQLRAQLGNDIAIKAFKEGTVPFPDGSIIAAIHWTRVSSEDNNKVLNGPFPGTQSFVLGSPVNVQFMVKDSKKYPATGGWGFGDFKGGKPGDKALHETCFGCHVPAKDHDFVFARYAPAP